MQRPLLLNGFMATGKSTVGRAIAKGSGHPFVDLDEAITARAGKTIVEIFRDQGEPAFRTLERAELRRLLADWPARFERAPVVALGGGALLDRTSRLDALRSATVLSLTATVDDIRRRTAHENARPLLQAADGEHVQTLLELRGPCYAEAHGVLDTSAEGVSALATRALELWGRNLIAVAAGTRSYSVEVGRGLLARRLPELVSKATGALLVTDTTVETLYGSSLFSALKRQCAHAALATLLPGEREKTLSGVERIWQGAFSAKLDRSCVVLGLGGGVVTDMAGFAAASWMRGVRWCALPTTLLGMVDASVGGKTGVDFGVAKNAVGAFWQPFAVVADVDTLASETDRAYVGALAEVVKTALIGDEALFQRLEAAPEAVRARDPELTCELVRRSIAVKADIVSRDERESGRRAVLNLGHTFGHALEAEEGFTRYTHGEAVGLGLGVALRVGEALGVTPPELRTRTEALLTKLGLGAVPKGAELARATSLIAHDKKRTGTDIKFVVVTSVGKAETHKISIERLSELAGQISTELA